MEVEQQYGDQVTFIGVPGLANVSDMEVFVERHGIEFENVPDLDQVIWDRFDVRRQRTYVLINDDGTWEQKGYGSLPEDVQSLIAR